VVLDMTIFRFYFYFRKTNKPDSHEDILPDYSKRDWNSCYQEAEDSKSSSQVVA